jgi:hypothetical protein
MTQFDNTNRGALFNNRDRKEKDSQPDYSGTLNVDGKEYFLNGWLKDGKSGKFFSLSVKPKEQQKAPQKPVKQAPKQEFDDSDVPF